jgi:hypothetical protein
MIIRISRAGEAEGETFAVKLALVHDLFTTHIAVDPHATAGQFSL